MPPVRTIARFFVVALVVYTVLVLPWPGVRSTYRNAFLVAGRAMFSNFGDEGLVVFQPSAEDEDAAELLLGKRGEVLGGVRVETGQVGFVPCVIMVALVVATPSRWKRKLRALFVGTLLVNVFVVFRIWLLLLYSFCKNEPYRLYDPGPFWGKIVSRAAEFFFFAPTCSFMVPILIWFAVALYPEDIAAAFGMTRGKTTEFGTQPTDRADTTD